jgi:hypothetical protein
MFEAKNNPLDNIITKLVFFDDRIFAMGEF